MSIDSPSVVALAGPNGAGKSTVGADLIRASLGISTFVNADVIAQGLAGFDPEAVAVAAGRVMLDRLEELADRRVSFAFETTLAGRAYASRVKKLIDNGYRFHVVFLWLDSVELAIARVDDRVESGGHAIPEPVIRRRYRAGLRNFLTLYRPLAVSWRVYDNSGGSPALVASGIGSRTREVTDRARWANVTGVAEDEAEETS